MRERACMWGGCNGVLGADGRCDRCGSKHWAAIPLGWIAAVKPEHFREKK